MVIMAPLPGHDLLVEIFTNEQIAYATNTPENVSLLASTSPCT